mgnify:CR=1 FL=1
MAYNANDKVYISMCCGDKCCVKYEIYVRNGRQGLQNVRLGCK